MGGNKISFEFIWFWLWLVLFPAIRLKIFEFSMVYIKENIT